MEPARPSLDEFTGLSICGLDRYDILTLNYFAARGLPGTEKSSLDAWLDRQKIFGDYLKFEIRRLLPLFNPRAEEPTPASYGNSLARFFCWHMLRILQLHCGVKYHPERKFNPDSCKLQDIFVHGIMDEDGEGGCCASMPVVYVSMGRYIGLPVYLVETRGHAFFRYDSPKGTAICWKNPDLNLWIPPARCNIEGSGEGIAFYSDDYFKLKPIPWEKSDYEHGRYLLSKTPKQEFAGFLIERGECFWELGNKVEALKAYYYANQLCPDDPRYKWIYGKRSHECLISEADREFEEEFRRQEKRRIPGAPGHSKYCECAQCRVWRENPVPVPPHGDSCQCADCRRAREAATQPVGMFGHPPSCKCPGCAAQRHFNPTPAAAPAAFGTPIRRAHLPHQPTRLVLPGSHPPIPRIPGF